MVAKALPQAIKKCRARSAKHAKLVEAAEAYKKAQDLGVFQDGKPTLRRVASFYNVALGTLHRRVTGGRTMAEYAASQQILSPAEEEKLVEYLLECSDRGCPRKREHIIDCADTIIRQRSGDAEKTVGGRWVDRFLQRHEDKLGMHWSKPLDVLRAEAMNPEAVSHWFQLVEELVVKRGIKPSNIYGMDESGFQLSFNTKQRVVGRKGAKVQHKQGHTDRENVTVIVTICANGTYLHPTIIYKGVNFMSKWGDNNVSKAS